MKKAAVIYYSKHGAAKQYAEWIAEETGADLFDGEKTSYRDLEPYDVLIFGGGIYSGGIRGRDFIRKGMRKKFAGKLVLAFGVGIAVDSEENRLQADQINFQKRMVVIPCWYFPGKYDPAQITGFDSQVMKMTKKMIEGGDANAFGRTLLGYIENGCDLIDRSRIEPMVETVRGILRDDTVTRQSQIAPPDEKQRARHTDTLLQKFKNGSWTD